MLQYIRDHFTALYLTDANGNPTQHDLLDPNGVSLLTGSTPAFQVPNTFATNQWSVATGTNPAEIIINVSVLPANNGSAITAIQYRVGTGAWVTLPQAATGTYPVTMPATSTAYSISLRAINVVGPSAQSAAKTATSGAPAATAPAAFGPAQWTLATGTEPSSLTLNILTLPNNGGSPITAIEYKVGSGEWVAFADAETGPRSLTMPAAGTAYSVTIRAVNAVNPGPAAAAKTATSKAVPALPKINATIAPDPLQANKPATITFDIAPEFVNGSSNITLTDSGDGLTWTFTAPDFGDVQISATAGGYEPFLETYPVDTETIEATVVPVQTATHAGQTIGDIPNIDTYIQASNYSREGRVINPPELKRNGQTATLLTVLAKGDIVDVLVTDNMGGSETFRLSTTQYAVEIVPINGGQSRAIDDNPILPDDKPITIPFLGATTTLTQAELAAGLVPHIQPRIVRDGDNYIGTPSYCWSSVLGEITRTYRWLQDGVPIPGQNSLTLPHIADYDDDVITLEETAVKDGFPPLVLTSNAIDNGGGTVAFEPLDYMDKYYSSSTNATKTWSAIPFGAPHAQREIFVMTQYRGGNGIITAVTIGGVPAELVEIVHSMNGATTIGSVHISVWKAVVPTGESGAIETVQTASGVMQISVFRGVNVVVSAKNKAFSSSNVASLGLTLPASPAGHKIYAVVVGSDGPFTWNTGAELQNLDFTGANRWTSLITATSSGDALPITAAQAGAATALAMIAFAAGAAA